MWFDPRLFSWITPSITSAWKEWGRMENSRAAKYRSASMMSLTPSSPCQINQHTILILSSFPRVSEMTFFIFFLEDIDTQLCRE